MKIYLFRHGETDWNKQRRLQGQSDVPLNAFGIELAEKTARALEQEGTVFDRAFSSPLSRALETARILSGGLPTRCIISCAGRNVMYPLRGRNPSMRLGRVPGHFSGRKSCPWREAAIRCW